MIYFVLVVMLLAGIGLVFMFSIPGQPPVKGPSDEQLKRVGEVKAPTPIVIKEATREIKELVESIEEPYVYTEPMRKKKQQSNVLEWFVVDRALGNISAAEQLIVNELQRYRCEWYREVAFPTLRTSEYGYARYDFLILTDKSPVGFLLCEYDGKDSHSTPEQLAKDTMKNKFCYQNNIPIVRYTSVHYYQMSYEIAKLMNQWGIKKRTV